MSADLTINEQGPVNDANPLAVKVISGGGGAGGGGDASAANQATQITQLGAVTEAVPATDTASSGLNGRLQRIAQALSTQIARFPAAIGQLTKSGSLSVTLASDDDSLPRLGTLTETAPATDTASSGLNGRLQRIAQRISSLMGQLPATLGQKAKTASMAVTLASDEDLLTTQGAVNETAPASDTASSGLNGRLQRVAQRLTSLIAQFPATLGQKAKATSLAVTLASDEDLIALHGAVTETAPASDTASSGLNGRLQRIAQRLTSLIALLPTALTGSGNFKVALAEITGSSENVIGRVGTNGNVAIVSPVVSLTAYSANDALGGKLTITNAVRVSGGTGTLLSIGILDRANQKPAGTLIIFNADPTAATITDNLAFVFSTDDLKVIHEIPVLASDYITINNKAFANLSNLGREVKANAATTSLFAAFVLSSTPTFVATTDVQITFGIAQD